MQPEFLASDTTLLDVLRKRDGQTVAELAALLCVTATAVRQRLTRLLAQGLIERKLMRGGRGRPGHEYSLTTAGRRKTGANFADLAMALWEEIRLIKDTDVRRGLLSRVSRRLAEVYAQQIDGHTIEEKMAALAEVFEQRQVPFEVDRSHELPILTALACPYPDLAERDRSVCAMERMLFEELLGEDLKLSQCRLDGGSCCTFELTVDRRSSSVRPQAESQPAAAR
jgi:predicted ArsR family transcriptional regulator